MSAVSEHLYPDAALYMYVSCMHIGELLMDNLQNIWLFFHELDEFVYASDIETNELVYLNRKALGVFGLKSIDEVKGRKCYEVLQNASIPCGMCTNDQLSVGACVEWRYYNPVIDRHLLLKDTMVEDPETKRKYRIEIAIDITEEKARDAVIEMYREMEMLANKGLKKAIAAETPDESIQIILEHLGKALTAERTYVFEKNENNCDDNTYEWCAPGVTPEKETLQNVPPEVCANWYRHFEDGKHIVIPDLEETKETDPLQYETLKRQGIRSLVVIPLYENGRVIAFYGADNPPSMFLKYAYDMLQIAATFLLSCLKRRKLLAKLMDLSYKDALTDLGNRFALVDYAKQLDREQSVAVVYCDITGLKQVNDSQGHEAGDALIINSCKCLKQVYSGYGVFRIGGDELLAICPGIARADADDRVALLRQTMKEFSANMAIGMVWRETVGENLYPVVQEAEKRMYADKAEYYRASGIDRRRR